MGLGARWGAAIAAAIAAFVLSWWICEGVLHLDEGVTFGVAGAALAIVLGFGCWWAPRVADEGNGAGGTGGYTVHQDIRAKNAYVAARDQLNINNRRDDK